MEFDIKNDPFQVSQSYGLTFANKYFRVVFVNVMSVYNERLFSLKGNTCDMFASGHYWTVMPE